jgi:hypothetical protein
MENNQKELEGHFKRNENMWKLWVEHGVNSETELTVDFHFYASKKQDMENLCRELEADDLTYKVKQTKTLLFLKGWEIETSIVQKWTLSLLQAKTGRMFLMSLQTGASLEGCGALLP